MTHLFDEAYVREILKTNLTGCRDSFYRACQADLNAGYSEEVHEAWCRRRRGVQAQFVQSQRRVER